MNGKKIASILVLNVIFPMYAVAEWVRSVEIDEMRQTETVINSNTVSPLNRARPDLSLHMIDGGGGSHTVIFELERGVVDGCSKDETRLCDLDVRFDEGSVKSLSFASTDGVTFIPTDNGAFAGAVVNASVLYIEVSVGGVINQYKYDLKGLDVDFSTGPLVTFLGFNLGERYPDKRPTLEVSKTQGNEVCYSGEEVREVLAEAVVKKVTLCFYKDFFYRATIVPGDKKSYDAVYRLMVKYFGKPDPDALYPRWPDDKDKLVGKNVKSAFYLTFDKANYNMGFIVTDDSVDLLVPDEK